MSYVCNHSNYSYHYYSVNYWWWVILTKCLSDMLQEVICLQRCSLSILMVVLAQSIHNIWQQIVDRVRNVQIPIRLERSNYTLNQPSATEKRGQFQGFLAESDVMTELASIMDTQHIVTRVVDYTSSLNTIFKFLWPGYNHLLYITNLIIHRVRPQ